MKRLLFLSVLSTFLFMASCEKCYDCTREQGQGAPPDHQNFCGGTEATQQADGLEALGYTCN